MTDVLLKNLQRAGVLFGESGQEDIGKVDEESTYGLFGCIKKPGKGTMDSVFIFWFWLTWKVRFFFFFLNVMIFLYNSRGIIL